MSIGQRPLPQCDVQIRWMIRRDMPEVLSIERQSFEFAWSEEEFLNCLRQRNCIGMVVEHRERIVGYMIYELLKSRLHLLNLAVAPQMRQQGVGRQMIEKLVSKLAQQRRYELYTEIRETNLSAQKFFARCGLKAFAVVRNFYEDSEEDAYIMHHQVAGADRLSCGAANRISSHLADLESDDRQQAA